MTWEYYLQDGRGPYETVQLAMDELGLDKNTRPQHNRWSRLSAQLRGTIQRRPAVGTSKAKFQRGDRVRFSGFATKYILAELLRRRSRTITNMFYDPVKQCCYYELGARGGSLGYYFRSFMLTPANGSQHTIGRPRQKRRYNYA